MGRATLRPTTSLLDSLDHPLILDALPDPVSVLHPDGRIAYANPAAARLLGRSPAELLDASIWSLFPGAQGSFFEERFRQAVEGQVEQRTRIYWAQRDVWLDFRFLPCRTGVAVLTRNITAEQRLHSALEENEERLRLAQQVVGAGTWDWNQATGKVIWSEGIWRMLGLEVGSIESTAEEWNSRIHPEDRERVCKRSDEVLAHGETYEEEFRLVQPDGRAVWVVCLGRVIRNAQGQAVRFLGINLDITRRKEAEQGLAESEARYRFITEALPQVIWMANAEGALVECNHQWYALTGLTPEEMRDGSGTVRVVHPDDLERIRAEWREHLAREEECQFEYRILRAADGTYRWYFGRAMPIRDAKGRVERWLGTAFDIQELKDAEEAVRRSEAFHRALIEQAGEGFWLTDGEGRCREVNRAACEMLGYSREELLGASMQAFFHPDDVEGREEDLRLLSQGETVRAERRVRRKDGSYLRIEGTGRMFQGNLLAFFHDVTQRRAAEEALRAREQEFRAIFDVASVGVALANPQTGHLRRVNHKLCEILGYSAEELEVRTLHDVTHPEDVELGASYIRKALAGPSGTWELQKRYVRKDGAVIWGQVSGAVLRDGDGHPYAILGMMHDITSARRAHEALVESERALREAQRMARLGTWSLDFRTGERWWSEELYRLYGREAGTVSPSMEAVRRIFHPEDCGTVEALIEAARERGESYQNVELRVLRPDGSLRWLLAQGEVERDRAGRPVRLVGSCLDITERKRLEAEVEERARALEAESRRKDQFLAMLAHELRNPLSPVLNATHLLKLRDGDPAFVGRQREIIDRNARHLARLVDDLLEVSRFNQGKIELRKERVEVGALVQQAVTSIQPTLQARGHRLSVMLEGEELIIHADPVRVVQILSNLLTNAAKYTDEGGHIQLSAHRENEEAVVRVRDNGRGIDPELLPRVFDLFVQGERTLARSDGGLGVGLTLTRTLAEMHGGTISAASEGLHQGSEFTVRLPLAVSGE